MRHARSFVVVLAVAAGCGEKSAPPPPEPPAEKTAPAAMPERREEPVKPDFKAMLERFAPIEIGVDESSIPERHRKTLRKLVEAARLVDQLYLRQVAAENPTWRATLAKDPTSADALALFDVMYGPWDRLDGNKPFFGDKAKPKGATFYPEDLTAQELEAYIAAHPEKKEALTSYFTVVKRGTDGLEASPYSVEYRAFLEPAAALLDEAAALAADKRLKRYLGLRAKAFRDNEYRASDMAWMDLGDGDLEVVIGPYEVYEDEFMGYKAAFEAFIALRDPETSAELAKIRSFIPEMEKNLPLPDELKKFSRAGKESPISVVDLLFSAGDARQGVQTLAFNLPNDEVVREKKGSKKVMLKNVAHAKYDQILMPIARQMMREDQVANVDFDAFFNHTLLHETAHGLGPGNIEVERDGKTVKTSVNQELKDLYSVIEEAKADSLGLHETLFLADKGHYPQGFAERVYATFLGGFFRSVRFGANEAHGKANAIQFNWFVEKGAVTRGADGRYAYVAEKMPEAVRSLVETLLLVEARGDYGAAKALVEKYGTLPDDVSKRLAALQGVPVDIRPTYTIERQMLAW